MKTFSVIYDITTSCESVVKAKSKKEAENKVREVIGEPIRIEKVYEITETE